MSKYEKVKMELLSSKRRWLVTGVAGFIGSNLLETLLMLNQEVVGLDNFSTGFKHNLEEVEQIVGYELWKNFKFIEGDIRDLSTCENSVKNINYVLHQAALGSVPRSIENPILTNSANITGFLHMLTAAKNEEVESFVYAASSSTYGDHPDLPKVEHKIGNPLSPYAVTKYVNELYSNVFNKVYGFQTIGLRYFNVFGKRQNPDGAYAAVIPKWTSSILKNNRITINGDGKTSRDFCYIDNVVQMNILAATTTNSDASAEVYNTALNDRTDLNQLFGLIKQNLISILPGLEVEEPLYADFRSGDVRHSQADISKAELLLGYEPTHNIESGLSEAMRWYYNNLK